MKQNSNKIKKEVQVYTSVLSASKEENHIVTDESGKLFFFESDEEALAFVMKLEQKNHEEQFKQLKARAKKMNKEELGEKIQRLDKKARQLFCCISNPFSRAFDQKQQNIGKQIRELESLQKKTTKTQNIGGKNETEEQ